MSPTLSAIWSTRSRRRRVERGVSVAENYGLILDHRALFSHRAMAAILGVILQAAPVKRALASQQMKSRYLEAILARVPV